VLGRLQQLRGECVVCREQDEARGPLACLAHVQVRQCACFDVYSLYKASFKHNVERQGPTGLPGARAGEAQQVFDSFLC
jgi:hypothetical protein